MGRNACGSARVGVGAHMGLWEGIGGKNFTGEVEADGMHLSNLALSRSLCQD